MGKSLLIMDNCFFTVSLVIFAVVLFMLVFLNGFIAFVGIIVVTYVFSDRVRKIENRWREIDESEDKQERGRLGKSG